MWNLRLSSGVIRRHLHAPIQRPSSFFRCHGQPGHGQDHSNLSCPSLSLSFSLSLCRSLSRRYHIGAHKPRHVFAATLQRATPLGRRILYTHKPPACALSPPWFPCFAIQKRWSSSATAASFRIGRESVIYHIRAPWCVQCV